MAHSLPSQILTTCSHGTFYCFWEWANTVTSGLFSILVLLAFCVVVYMATSRYGSVRAIGFAGFVSLIGGIWFAVLTFIPWSLASAFIIGGIIGISMMIVSERN